MIGLTYCMIARISDIAHQSLEIAPVVSVQLAIPGSLTTSSLHLSLLEAQALAWRTRIMSVQGIFYYCLLLQHHWISLIFIAGRMPLGWCSVHSCSHCFNWTFHHFSLIKNHWFLSHLFWVFIRYYEKSGMIYVQQIVEGGLWYLYYFFFLSNFKSFWSYA